jgi:hypothetical protein
VGKKNITTPTGQGDSGLTASFREIPGLKATGLSDAMSTPRNLDNVLQQKGDIYMTKEGEKETYLGYQVEVSRQMWWEEFMELIGMEWNGL